MSAKGYLRSLAVAGFLLGGAGMAMAQEASQGTEELSQAAPDITAQDAEVAVNQFLGLNINAVDVWLLRCTTTPGAFVQVARAQVRDLGGVDGRRFYVHLTRRANGRTSKSTAADGGLSGIAAVPTGGAGSDHFVIVGKDRAGAEPYRLGADCIAGGIVRPHVLFLIQNQ